MKTMIRHQAVLVFVAMMIFFTNLGNYALFNEDEPKNAVCGAEMFRRGDWIVPTFNEDLRTDKPILIYWLMLTSFHLFGVSEFSARLPSSLLAVGTTLLTYHLGRKLYSANVGFLAGIILCTCLMYSAVGRAATPDSTLIFFVTLTFLGYVWVVAKQRQGCFSGLEKSPERIARASPAIKASNSTDTGSDSSVADFPFFPMNWKLAALPFVAMGLAVLAKGPVGVVLPTAIIGLFLLISKREQDLEQDVLTQPDGSKWRRWFLTIQQIFRPKVILQTVQRMNLLIGLGIVAAIALPWYLTVGVMTNGDWLRGFFLDHNLGRAFVAKEQHTGFPFYYLYYVVAIHLCSFPWSVFLPVAVYQLRRRFIDGADCGDSDRFVACWASVWFVVFSLASTKLPNYVLPMYPAMALILARFIDDWKRSDIGEGVYSFNLCCRALIIVGAVMIVGVIVAAYLYFPSEQWLGITGVIPMLGGFAAIKFLDQEKRERAIQSLIGTAVLIAIMVVGIGPARISHYQDSPLFIAEAKRLAAGEDFEIGTYSYFQPSVVFYAQKKVRLLQTPRQVADFLSSRPHAFVITRLKNHNELRDELGSDVRELMRHRDFLRREELILLGKN